MPFTGLGLGGSTVFNPGVTYTFTAIQNFSAGIAMGGPITWPGSGPGAHDSILNASPQGEVIFQGETFTLQNDQGNPAPLTAGAGSFKTSVGIPAIGRLAADFNSGQNPVIQDDSGNDVVGIETAAGDPVEFHNGGVKILTQQQSGIPDATALTIQATVNAILAVLRESSGHGLIGG